MIPLVLAHGCHLKWGSIRSWFAWFFIYSSLGFYFGSYFRFYSPVSGVFGVLSITTWLAVLIGMFSGRAPWGKILYKRVFLDICKPRGPPGSASSTNWLLFYVGLHLEYRRFRHCPLQICCPNIGKRHISFSNLKLGIWVLWIFINTRKWNPNIGFPMERLVQESMFLSNGTELKSREWVFGLKGKTKVGSSQMIPPFLLVLFSCRHLG